MRRFNLEDKTAVITGGGGGIGRGIALALAHRGAAVVLAGRRVEPLLSTADAVRTLGGQAAVVVGDITTAEARRNLLERAQRAFGAIHVLVNNAGVLAGGGLLQLGGAEIERAVATNLGAPVDLTRLFLPDLMHTRGAVVFVGSTASRVPLPYTSLYSATKAGLHAFCTALRYELLPLGVHLLEAFPPTVDTRLTETMARNAGRWAGRREDAEAAGERIVAALAAGQDEVQWGAGERLLIALQRCAPRLLAALLTTQRGRFARIMTPARDKSGNG